MSRRVVVGKIKGAHGIGGSLKVESFTEEPNRLFALSPWYIETEDGEQRWQIDAGKTLPSGRDFLIAVPGLGTREAAHALRGKLIAVDYDALPPAGDGEYYWVDLIGLDVMTKDDIHLGKIVDVFETGANDVLVVEGEGDDPGSQSARRRQWLLPYVDQVVLRVDVPAGRMVVDWDPAF